MKPLLGLFLVSAVVIIVVTPAVTVAVVVRGEAQSSWLPPPNTLYFRRSLPRPQQDGCPPVTWPKIRSGPVTPLVSDPTLQSSY